MSNSNNDIMVKTVDLVKIYEDGNVKALNGVNLEVRKGEFIGIRGPSGSGKSTLLHIIGALDYPTSGEVFLNGKLLSREINLNKIRAKEIGFIFQLHNLIPTLTAIENVEIPMYALGINKKNRREQALDLLNLIGLSNRANFIITKLSGGERQRVAIARALVNNPSLILADEPTGNLDSKTSEQVIGTLIKLKEKTGTTLIVVTHNAKVVDSADRVMEMSDGLVREVNVNC